MRHKGSTNEWKERQDEEILAAYKSVFLSYGGMVSVARLYELTAFAPASRFFVSDSRAASVVARLLGGRPVGRQRVARLRMYSEIARRARLLMDGDPRLTLAEAVRRAIAQPAPEMYISPRQVAAIIEREKKRYFEKRWLRLRHTL